MSEKNRLHALLIGVDHYQPPPERASKMKSYKSLSGCVHDVRRMERFLLERMRVPEECIRILTASNPPQEIAADLPTYVNMVQSFHELCHRARTGDQVLIHYSGHGGRTPTLFPDLKGKKGKDEGLVPTNISRPDSQYLRDVELNFLIETMLRKGLFITMVLDCCHSGGASRDDSNVPGAESRGNWIDDWQRSGSSRVASAEDLAQSWRRMRVHRFAQPAEGSGWLPRVDGYVVLAACRENELAYEYPVAPRQRGGALTHWIFDTLERFCPQLPGPCDFTYKQLHDRVRARVNDLFPQQMPQLEGEADRRVLQRETSSILHAVSVLKVQDEHVCLNTGQAQAVRRGARFALFPADWKDQDHAEARLAVVKVDRVGGAESWARIVEQHTQGDIEPGARALLIDIGKIRLRRTVGIELGEGQKQEQVMEALRTALLQRGSAFLELLPEPAASEHRVRVNSAGEFEILDARGRLLPNLRPALSIARPDVVDHLVERLVHLARFRNVEELYNADTRSPLSGKIHLELGRLAADFELGDPLRPQPLLDTSDDPHLYEVGVGDWICLTIENQAPQTLNFTALDLGPRWNISQIYPLDGDALVLDPGRRESFPMQARLPPGIEQGRDVLKVFGTVDVTQFRWLELPILDSPIPEAKGEITNPLEALMAAMAEEGPQSKDLRVTGYASREWTVEELAFEIRSSS